MKYLLWTLLIFAAFVQTQPGLGTESYIVNDGHSEAEIIIAEHAPRTTRLAANELQTYVKKITGAQLAISTEPNSTVPVKIYVGQSPFTEKLNITASGLQNGAYRIVSRDNWLALIGDDTDFVPIEPWPRSNNDLVSGKMQKAWDEITGATWGYPLTQLRKHYTGSVGSFGRPGHEELTKDGMVNVWGFDERGSYNAVCGFLRSLGVRWYLPGELGEVVPSMTTIRLPSIDETVHPDFAVRRFNIRFGVHGLETARWAMRLGIRDPYGLRVAHGMNTMTHREEILESHPDWFALYGGKRDNQPGKRLNHLCYSNEELFQETVRWARAQFDHFKFDTVSIMPPDAYISICQCPLCAGKDSPERDYRGRLSNHVWDFVNRVAKEVGKTHPNKKIVCCAYGANTDPPQNIDKLEPNVQVIIVGGRRPANNKPSQRDPIRRLRDEWVTKTDNPLMIFENYPFTDRGFYLPAFVSRSIGTSINATKGISQGEDIWLSVRQDFDTVNVGFNHFLVYFTARMYWGGPDQDVVAMLNEYCRLFYGPAGNQMKVFLEYCEDHWQEMEKDKATADTALELFAAAQSTVSADSIYGKRIALIDDFLESLRNKSEQLGNQRGPVPQLRMVWDAEDIVIDGKLDDTFWKKCPTASTGRFRELQTGRLPTFETTFKSGWGRGGDLYFAIRCNERPGEKLNIATTKNEDQSIWYGDVVEILLETDSHSYYQIAVNPQGAMIDLDRGAAKSGWFRWESQAEVATQVADDHWTVEIRIPVTDDENDPLNQVIGRKPTASLPWHINLCRQRIRDVGSEHSAFSPTGQPTFHHVMKFAHFYDGRSQQFSHAEPDQDYLEQRRVAYELSRKGKRVEAISAYLAAARNTLTDFQKSDALTEAAALARMLKDNSHAEEIADQAPIKPVADMIKMQNLIAQRAYSQLIEQFGKEDLSTWPFWVSGEAYFARGRAYAASGAGDEAASDLNAAMEYTSDAQSQLSILRAIGNNHETNRHDDRAALNAYLRIVDFEKNTGSSEYYYGVLGAARLLTKREDFEKALAVLYRVDVDKLRGTWRGAMLLALAETLSAAGKQSETLAIYDRILTDEAVTATHKEAAKKAMERRN